MTQSAKFLNNLDDTVAHHMNKNADLTGKYNPLNRFPNDKFRQEYNGLVKIEGGALLNEYNHNDRNQICDKETDILILVNSRTSASDERAAIRDTWGKAIKEGVWLGKALQEHVSIGFVVDVTNSSVNITREKSTHRDIIQGDFVEHDKNLARKSLFAMGWANAHCKHARYFIKMNDDVIVNIPHIIRRLNQTNFTRTIMGPLIQYGQPERWRGKRKVTEKEYPEETYPPYMVGTAYVITMDLIRPLLDASRELAYLHIDDVYITGILAKHVHASHAALTGFSFWGSPVPSINEFLKGIRLSGHGFPPDMMRSFWDGLGDVFYYYIPPVE